MSKTYMLTMKNDGTQVAWEEETKIAVFSHFMSNKLLKKEQLSIPNESVKATTENGKMGCYSQFDSASPLCNCCILLEKHHPQLCQE